MGQVVVDAAISRTTYDTGSYIVYVESSIFQSYAILRRIIMKQNMVHVNFHIELLALLGSEHLVVSPIIIMQERNNGFGRPDVHSRIYTM